MDGTKIKRESNTSDQNENEFDLVGNYHHEKRFDNNNQPSKKTMNDVLKLLTNKMQGSSIKEGRLSSAEQDFESKM